MENIIVEKKPNGVGLIQFNRPKVMNALNRATMDEVVDALTQFQGDADVRAAIITGNERAFAAGADIAEFQNKTTVDMLTAYRFQQYEFIRKYPKPIIAAVSGWCLGGGCELAMICDMIVASESARFGQPEINLGLIPGAGGTQRLARAVGKALAMEMILADRKITAQEAYQFGLVNQIAPVELYLERAIQLAEKVASMSPLAASLAKESILKVYELSLDDGLEYERKNFYLLFSSKDKEEGVSAFLEKRKPQWTGK